MKRKIFTLLLGLAACLCLAFGLVACGSSGKTKEPVEGTYYLYIDGELDKSESITLEGGKWTVYENGSAIIGGDYALKGTAITLRPAGASSTQDLISGTVENGKLTLQGAGVVYYKEGSQPGAGDTPGGGTAQNGYTVTFHANGGTFDEEAAEPVEEYVLDGVKNGALKLPAEPVRQSYDFLYWSYDESGYNEYDPNRNITRDFDLYAQWEIAAGEYEVTFYPYVGAEREVHLTENGLITYIPERTGYVFTGWWLGDGSVANGAFYVTERWDMNAPVTYDMELYGTWTAEEDEVRKLSAPTLNEADGVFTWKAVPGATGYEIGYSSNSYNDYTNYTISADETLRWEFPSWESIGGYNVRIRSLGDGITTVNSGYATTTYSNRILRQTSIEFDQSTGMLSWTTVPHADNYYLTIDDEAVSNFSSYRTTYDMSSYDAGTHTVTVEARGGSYQSSTATATFTKYRLKTVEPEAFVQKSATAWEYYVTWDEAAHADSYDVYLNGEWVENTEEPFCFIPQTLSAWTEGDRTGVILFEVAAVNDAHDYVVSKRSEAIELARLYSLTLRSAGDEELTAYGYLSTPMEFQVNFDGNASGDSVSNVPSSQTVSKTCALSYPSNLPTRDGYVCRGWYTEPECENLYDFSATVTHDITLYAGWYEITTSGYRTNVINNLRNYSYSNMYQVTTSGTSSGSANYTYFTALTSGTYTFCYCNLWGGANYTTSFSIYNATKNQTAVSSTTISDNISKNVTFTADAGDVLYVRSYKTNSETNFRFYMGASGGLTPADGGKSGDTYTLGYGTVTASAATAAGEQITVTAPSSSVSGGSFIGWYRNGTRISQSYEYHFTMLAEDTVLWARYSNDYTLTVEPGNGGTVGVENSLVQVSFNLNGSYGAAPVTQTVTEDTPLTYPTIPTRSGNYLFGGWYTESGCTGDPFDFSARITASVTLYAKWVSYDGAGAIAINGSTTVEVYGEGTGSSESNGYYAFVPLVSGEIEIHSSASFDTKGYLYDATKGSSLDDDDDGFNNNNQFQIKYQVTAGQLYYIKATGYSGNSGSVTIYVNGAMPADGGISGAGNWMEEHAFVRAGTQIEFTATPSYGYEFSGWFQDNSTRLSTEETYTFTMPASDVTLSAQWRRV